MRSANIKILKKAVYIACLTVTSNHALAGDCTFSGDTTISADCTGGTISSADSTITINAGVTHDISTSAFTVNDSVSMTAFINNGTINGGINPQTFRAYRRNDIGTFTNNGTVTLNGPQSFYIYNDGDGNHGAFNNTGTWNSNGSQSFYSVLGTNWTSLTNSGTLTANGPQSLYLDGTASGIGTIGTLTNSGTLTTNGVESFYNGIDHTITNFINSGTWALGASGAGLHGTITTLTNIGAISGNLKNSGTLTTFNNGGVVAYQSALPVNYNIIINSTSDFGKLNVTSGTGATTFGIHSSSTATYGHTYSSVLTGVSASNLTATSGTYSQGGITSGFTLSSSDDSAWDLRWGANVTDTKLALRKYAKSIGAIFSQSIIASNYAHMNTYDCNVYGEDGSCFSVGSRTTRVDDPDTNSTSGILNFGHKLSSSWRLGAFMDQTINNSAASGIKVDNKGPMVGLMAVWNQNPDTNGLQLRLGNTYQSKDVGITREIIGSAEPGKGNTTIETQSYLAELQYRFMVNDKTMIQPYAAIRRTTVEQDGYTEEATVGTPLTFAKLEDRTSTVIAGIKTRHRLKNMTYLKGALGIEHDVSHTKHNIRASGLAGLTDESFNNAENKNRVVATVGVDHYLSKNKVISANLHYQQLGFKSTDSTSLFLNYNIGF